MKQKIIITFVAVLASLRIMADNTLLVGTIDVNATVSESGGAVVTVPIDVPAGINGMQPNLALVYNSQGGMGTCGWGWSLSGLSSITRTGSTIYHDQKTESVRFTTDDHLMLDGQRLILESGSYWGTNSTYRTEIETFHLVSDSSSWFSVWTKDGIKMEYGKTAQSRLEGLSGGTLAWNISKAVDPNGNYIAYYYAQENGLAERNPSEIQYTGNDGTNTLPAYRVTFEYQNLSSPRHFYENGKRFDQTKRLDKIRVYSGNLELYRYELTYNTTGYIYPRLTSVQKYAGNGDTFYPVQFTWSTAYDGTVYSKTVSARKENLLFGDFNGDGMTDIFTYTTDNKTYTLFVNSSTASAVNFSSSQGQITLNMHAAQACDFNGDGKKDIVFSCKSGSTYYLYYLTLSGSLSSPNHIGSTSSDSFLTGDFDGDGKDEIVCPGVKKMYKHTDIQITTTSFTLPPSWSNISGFSHSFSENNIPLDFNGNGKTDILDYNDTELRILEYNENSAAFSEVAQTFLGNAGLTQFLCQYLRFGDFNGDGKTDILFPKINETETGYNCHILISKGNGFDTSRVQSIASPYIHTLDFNNDGLTDICYFTTDTNGRKLYIGRNNGADFSLTYLSMSSVTDNDLSEGKVFFFDLLGDGRSEFLSFYSTTTIKTKRLLTSHPLLLTRVTDSMGGYYDFTYKPVSDSSVYTATSSAFPVFPLTSSLYVVSGYTAPYMSMQYTYRGGRIHLQGKGFLGFTGTTVFDNLNSRRSQTTKALNSTYYLLEPKSMEVLTASGDSVSRTDYDMRYQTYAGKSYVFPYVYYTYTKDYLTTIRETIRTSYDSNGNLSVISRYKGGLENTTVNHYGKYASWCPNKVKDTGSYAELNGEYSNTRNTYMSYDTRGNLIRMVEDSTWTQKRVHTYAYDSFGHVTSETVSGSGQTHTTSTVWSADGRFPTSMTDALGMTTTYTYDTTKGLLMSSTAPMGTTTYSYDSFGRQISSTSPDGTAHSTLSTYVNGFSGIKYSITDSISAGPPVTTWYSPAGKALYKMTLGFNSQPVFTAYGYNTNGTTNYVSEPFFAANLGAARTRTFTASNATMYDYDSYGRIHTVYSPQDSIRYSYSGLSTWTESRESAILTTRNGTGMIVTKMLADGLLPAPDDPMQPRSFVDQSRSIGYSYYPTGQVKTITPDGSDTISLEYDIRGNRTKLIDPDAGTIIDTYNAFDQPIYHTQKIHGTSNVYTSYTYDNSGRLLSEHIIGNENKTKNYAYDTTFKNLVKKVYYDNSNQTTYSYDILGRLTYTAQTVGGTTMTESYAYGSYSQPSNHYHDGTDNENYLYDANGYQTKERLGTTDIWELLSVNERGQVLQEKRSGVTTTYTYDNAGRILSIYAPGIVYLLYEYDASGNLLSKTDGITHQKVTYGYDGKNRLTSWRVQSPVPVPLRGTTAPPINSVDTTFTMTYDDVTGNILTKSDLGANAVFDYGTSSKPHALDGITGVTDGLMADPVSITYTDFGKVKTVSNGSAAYAISYAAQGGRGKSALTGNGIHTDRYYGDGTERVYDWNAGIMRRFAYFPHGTIIMNSETIPVDKAASPQSDDAGGGTTVLSSPPSPPSGTVLQGYYDAQGSLVALVTTDGTVVRRYAYDPWGKRVLPTDWTQADTQADTYHINRGYTMHEHLDDFGLINMNGRVFDPLTAQFLSPDNYIQSDGNWLNYNRYAYCLNNPLKYSDPSGDIAIEAIVFSAYICGVVNLMSNHDAIMNSNNVATAALGYFTVGALAGAASSFVGGTLTGTMFYGGFLGGAASGAASSAASGFIMGAGNAWMGGASFSNGLLAGLQSGGIGALTGALMGGLSQGISDFRDGFGFWDGLSEPIPVESDLFSDIPSDVPFLKSTRSMDADLLQRIQDEGYDVDKIKSFKVKSITTKNTKGYSNMNNGLYSKNGKISGGYVTYNKKGMTQIHISPRIAYTSDSVHFKAVFEHEVLHSCHFSTIPKYKVGFSEIIAYDRTAQIYNSNLGYMNYYLSAFGGMERYTSAMGSPAPNAYGTWSYYFH